MFKSICIFIEDNLSSEAIQRTKEEHGKAKMNKSGETLDIDEVPLGFEVSDPLLRRAAVALRLLHIGYLRRLQNQANAAIVQVQALTADPKTDGTLGKVGF
ncbi:unnamed protein product [Protopolystoma xenopodis]|uniref:Uncharacterized protein n=1 Tax=Protopolystoma xenopodis TaxID=117903 RepID=A0A448XMZ2_9PLAT|nr:unnamed protein product [Protopolystoma xenopodis]